LLLLHSKSYYYGNSDSDYRFCGNLICYQFFKEQMFERLNELEDNIKRLQEMSFNQKSQVRKPKIHGEVKYLTYNLIIFATCKRVKK